MNQAKLKRFKIKLSINIFKKNVKLTKSGIQNGFSHLTIVKILKTFSLSELNEFEKMLNSPFFNTHSTLIKLFKELKKYYPNFNDRNMSKKLLISVVNKGKTGDDKLYRKYLSLLNKLAEEYLGMLHSRSEKIRKELDILSELSKRDLKVSFKRKLKDTEKLLEQSKIDPYNFFLKHRLNDIKYFQRLSQNVIESHSEDILEAYINILSYFLFYASSAFNQIEADKYTFDIPSVSQLPALLDRNRIEEFTYEILKITSPDVRDRFLILEMLVYNMKLNEHDSDLTAYRKLREMVHKNSENLSSQMLLHFLQRLNVFCVLENLRGVNDMSGDLFENYRLILQRNLFIIEGQGLSLLNFRLILKYALRCNETDWSEKFINENIHLIKEDLRGNIYNYGYAKLLFHKKNYSGSLNHILKIKNASLPITIDINIFKIKIFYMLGHYDSALCVANSFRHFINANKLMADYHKKTLLNFLKYFKAILRLGSRRDKSKLKDLLTELQDIQHIKERRWMNEIITERISDQENLFLNREHTAVQIHN